MTTPREIAGNSISAEPGSGDSVGTCLIAELANEIDSEFHRATGHSGAPWIIPGTSAIPAGLAGPYASRIHPSAPPVHPGVQSVSGQTAPLDSARADFPAHESKDFYAFGEPRCRLYSNSGGAGRFSDESAREAVSAAAKPPTKRDQDEFTSTPDLYFLEAKDVQTGSSTPDFACSDFGLAPPAFDVESIRRDFPALHQRVNGKPLIWLDNAATTHKPQSVIDAISGFYGRDNSNIHRAAHRLAARATELYEGSREKVRKFIGAADAKEIVFVRGTTEAVNLVAQTYGRKFIHSGDEILLTTMEHHANIVPWQILAEQTGAVIRVVPINNAGELILEQLASLLSSRTKLLAVTQVSNALGTINPIEQIIALAHGYGVPVFVDGAQSAPHLPVNVQALDADFFAFSGHKVFGPTGIGILYGKAQWLDQIPPYQGGGNMIQDVTFGKTTYQSYPQKFEAGTQDIAGVIGLGAAIDYLMRLGLPAIAAYEHELLAYATEALGSVPGLRPIGTAAAKASVLSFVLDGIPVEQVAKHLDQHGIAVRAGRHCAQPAVRHFGLNGTVRPSLAFYNTPAEIDSFVHVLRLLPNR